MTTKDVEQFKQLEFRVAKCGWFLVIDVTRNRFDIQDPRQEDKLIKSGDSVASLLFWIDGYCMGKASLYNRKVINK